MKRSRLILIVAWCTVLAGGVSFLFRGIARQNSDQLNDFGAPYVGSRLWLQGHDPYDSSSFAEAWNNAGGPVSTISNAEPSSSHVIYPPTTFPLLLPLSIFEWKTANRLLLLSTVGFYLIGIWMLLALIDEGWNGIKKPFFLAFALALAPIHSALHIGNIAGLAASFLLIGICILLQNWNSLAGVASIAISICLKPTLGIIFIPYLIVERRWRTLAMISLAVALVAAVSIFPLAHDSGWIDHYQNNISIVFTNGGAADISGGGRFDLLNLQVPFYAIFHSRVISTIVVYIVTVALLALWALLATENALCRTNSLLVVAALAVIGLLPFYQRYYSGIVLLLPMLWAMQFPFYSTQRLTTAICCFFLGNTEAFLRQTKLIDRLHQRFPHTANIIVGPHLCWILLILSLLLVGHLFKRDEEWLETRTHA